MDGAAAIGTDTGFSRGDHVHPSDTSRVAKTGDTMTGRLAFTAPGDISITGGGSFTTDSGNIATTSGVIFGTSAVFSGAVGAQYKGCQGAPYVGFGSDGPGLRAIVGGGDQGYLPYSGFYSIQLNGSGPLINFYYVGGSVYVNVNWSDRRLKSNIAPAGDALDLVNRIAIHRADYTPPLPGARTQELDFCFLADEVEAALPAAYVAPPDEDSFASVNELPLVAALWRANQQLSAQVTDLASRVAALERLVT